VVKKGTRQPSAARSLHPYSALRQEERRPGTRQEADSAQPQPAGQGDLDRHAIDSAKSEPLSGRAGPPEADGARAVF